MELKPPKLSCHATGVYFTHWGGRNHYFTKNREESIPLYAESIKAWAAWKSSRGAARSPRGVLTVAQVCRLFLEGLEADSGPELQGYYRKHLARFVNTWQAAPASAITAADLQALKLDMSRHGYAPKTINHDLLAVRRMYNWADSMGYVPLPPLRGAKAIRLPPPKPKSLPLSTIRATLELAERGLGQRSSLRTRRQLDPEPPAPQVAIWMRLQYLALLRPIEVVRLVHGHGELVEEGIFRLHVGKADKTSQQSRNLVLSPRALEVLAQARPIWSRLDSYSAAVRRMCGPGGPHALRHSAATHLHRAGVARAEIDLLLGHLPPRVSLIYAPITWKPLRSIAAGLSL